MLHTSILFPSWPWQTSITYINYVSIKIYLRELEGIISLKTVFACLLLKKGSQRENCRAFPPPPEIINRFREDGHHSVVKK